MTARHQRFGLLPCKVEHRRRPDPTDLENVRNPRVVISPVRAPDFWRIVFEPTVVPWTTSRTSLNDAPTSLSRPARPSTTACAGSFGVEATLRTCNAPSSSCATMSVNVPPISHPICIVLFAIDYFTTSGTLIRQMIDRSFAKRRRTASPIQPPARNRLTNALILSDACDQFARRYSAASAVAVSASIQRSIKRRV